MHGNKTSQAENYQPDIIKRLLGTPQLLPHEDSTEFLQLFANFEDYGKPGNSRDYFAVYQATLLTWDILRCQTMQVGVLRSLQRPALESLLRKILVRTAASNGIPEAIARAEARQLAAPWFNDPASRPALMQTIENAGYPPNAIEVEAFQLALPVLAAIERLIVSAQRRLDHYLADLERTSKASALALRLAAKQAIIDNDAAVLSAARR